MVRRLPKIATSHSLGEILKANWAKRLVTGLTLVVLGMGTTWAAESVKVTAERASLRSGPSTTSNVVGPVSRGDALEVLAKEGAWYKVRVPAADGAEGYIHSAVVESTGESASPSPTSSPRPSATAVAERPAPAMRPTATPDPMSSSTTSSEGFTAEYFDVGPIIGLGTGVGGSVSIGGRVEKGLREVGSGILGIGGFVQRWSYDCGLTVGSCDVSTTYLGATVNYHFTIKGNRKWDPFVGLGIGYARASGSAFGFKASADGTGFVGNAGVRYFFSEKMAAYADIGSGDSTLNLGVMFKLK